MPPAAVAYKLDRPEGQVPRRGAVAAAQSPELICVYDGTQCHDSLPRPQALFAARGRLAAGQHREQHDAGDQPAGLGDRHHAAARRRRVRPHAGDRRARPRPGAARQGQDAITSSCSGPGQRSSCGLPPKASRCCCSSRAPPACRPATTRTTSRSARRSSTGSSGPKPPEGAFAISLPKDARRVNEIYDALSGEEPAARIGKPLPKVPLTKLDGSSLELAAAKDKRATVLIFWATWCTSSGQDLRSRDRDGQGLQGQGDCVLCGQRRRAAGRRFAASPPRARWPARCCSTRAAGLPARSASRNCPRSSSPPATTRCRAVLQGTAKVLQGELTEELETILAEDPAKASTARRPNEPNK